MNQRTMDLIKMEADQRFAELQEKFQVYFLGGRVDYGSNAWTGQEDNLPGEVEGQLVQYSGENLDQGEEHNQGQPIGEEAGGGAGVARPA